MVHLLLDVWRFVRVYIEGKLVVFITGLHPSEKDVLDLVAQLTDRGGIISIYL